MPGPSFKRTCMILGRQIACTRAMFSTRRPVSRNEGAPWESFHLRERENRSNDIPLLAAKSDLLRLLQSRICRCSSQWGEKSGHRRWPCPMHANTWTFPDAKSRWCQSNCRTSDHAVPSEVKVSVWRRGKCFIEAKVEYA